MTLGQRYYASVTTGRSPDLQSVILSEAKDLMAIADKIPFEAP